MKSFTIGEFAKQAGVGVETVRFYEREGLLKEPPRRPSGHREYPEGEVTRLVFIRRAKELGFSLAEIKELLSLRANRRAQCGQVKKRTEAKLKDIDERIRTLRRMRRALSKLNAACDNEQVPTSECPILDALDREGR